MKKIISALTLGAMIGAAAFADVTVKLNYRQRASLYAASTAGTKFDDSKVIPATKTDKAFGWLDGYNGNGTDNMAISLAGDIAKFDVTLTTDEAKTKYIRAKVLMASLFLGPVTLQAGANSDGIVTGAYRANTDLNFGNFEGIDFEFKKLGSVFGDSPAGFVDNLIGHMGDSINSRNLSFVANYGLKFDSGAATFKAALVTNESLNGKAYSSTAHAQGHQFSFIADGQLKDIGRAEAVFKVGEYKKGLTAMAFGLYAQPSIKNLTLTAGGAVGVINYSPSDVSFDLRARYEAIPKKLSITSFHSFSFLTDDGIKKMSNKTTKGIANFDGVANDSDSGSAIKHGGSSIERDKILTNNIMVRYNVNDTLTVYGIAADMIGLGGNLDSNTFKTAKGDDPGAHVQLRFSGWAQFFATSAASINVGLVCSVDDVGNYMDIDNHLCSWNWTVPMILRIKF